MYLDAVAQRRRHGCSPLPPSRPAGPREIWPLMAGWRTAGASSGSARAGPRVRGRWRLKCAVARGLHAAAAGSDGCRRRRAGTAAKNAPAKKKKKNPNVEIWTQEDCATGGTFSFGLGARRCAAAAVF